MLDFLILDNKKFDYKQLLENIDTKIYLISKTSYYNAKLGLTDCVDYNTVELLIDYKQILIARLNQAEYLCKFELKDIIARIQKLINTNGFKNSKCVAGCN